MSDASGASLLDALLDSWDRNNTILTNLVRALPKGGLDARAMENSPSVAQMLTHIHYVRMVFVSEDAPEFAPGFVEPGPEGEWAVEHDRERLVQMLNESAKTVRDGPGKARIRPRNGSSLRSSDSYAPAHDLARRLSPWTSQTGPEACRHVAAKLRNRPRHLARLDAEEIGRIAIERRSHASASGRRQKTCRIAMTPCSESVQLGGTSIHLLRRRFAAVTSVRHHHGDYLRRRGFLCRVRAEALRCFLALIGDQPKAVMSMREPFSVTPSDSRRRRWSEPWGSGMSRRPPAPTTRCHGIPCPFGQAAMA